MIVIVMVMMMMVMVVVLRLDQLAAVKARGLLGVSDLQLLHRVGDRLQQVGV